MKSPQKVIKTVHLNNIIEKRNGSILRQYPVAIAQDKAFHFRYPETKEYLEAMGMPLINWQPTENQPIPTQAKALIIPGGFPELFAEEISDSTKSLESIRAFFGKRPIYAECGGMLLLGEFLTDIEGKKFPMCKLLPFNATKDKLKVGYRKLKSIQNSLILNKGDTLVGHEFHYWKINPTQNKFHKDIVPPWEVNGWKLTQKEEGWSNNLLHASWIHLHWPTASNVLDLWLKSITKQNSHIQI